MRLYIGIDLPPHIKHSLSKSQLRLKKLGVAGAWKIPDYFHITLEFLGELSMESVPALVQIMETVVSCKKEFKLHIESLGAFPSFHRAHTLWAGIGGNTEKLDDIWYKLHEELVKKGFVLQETQFMPHITLLTRPKVLVPDLETFKLRITRNFILSEVILFESKVEEGRRVYPHLYCARLKR